MVIYMGFYCWEYIYIYIYVLMGYIYITNYSQSWIVYQYWRMVIPTLIGVYRSIITIPQ